MHDQEEHEIVRGIKLAFGKVRHCRSSFELWINAAKLDNRRAIRLLARLMLNDIHDGLTKRRPMVLEALKAASILGPKHERLYLLFAWIASPGPDIVDSMIRLAKLGDEIASVFLGLGMDIARKDRDYGFLVQAYGFLGRVICKSGYLRAARLLFDKLRFDGQERDALSLMLWAANCGDFGAMSIIPRVARNFGFALRSTISERVARCSRQAESFSPP